MSSIYKTGANITPTVDTDRDVFNMAGGFIASYVSDSTGVATEITAAFTEILLTPVVATTTVSGAIVAGEKTLVLTDASVFGIGSTVSFFDGGGADAGAEIHYITAVDAVANTVTLKSPLKANVGDTWTVTAVGNTGMYNVTFTIPLAGDYKIVISNPELNMQNSIVPISVSDETLAEAQTKLDIITSELGSSAREQKFTAYV